MGKSRYAIKSEQISKSLIEAFVETGPLETGKAIRVTIKDEVTGQVGRGVAADYEDALDRACRELHITRHDLGQRVE